MVYIILLQALPFLSTPSGWRATLPAVYDQSLSYYISIHALRVEGDLFGLNVWCEYKISIHALRVEGDVHLVTDRNVAVEHFYPRPPGGGRLAPDTNKCVNKVYFYPRPPGGGRLFLGYDENV